MEAGLRMRTTMLRKLEVLRRSPTTPTLLTKALPELAPPLVLKKLWQLPATLLWRVRLPWLLICRLLVPFQYALLLRAGTCTRVASCPLAAEPLITAHKLSVSMRLPPATGRYVVLCRTLKKNPAQHDYHYLFFIAISISFRSATLGALRGARMDTFALLMEPTPAESPTIPPTPPLRLSKYAVLPAFRCWNCAVGSTAFSAGCSQGILFKYCVWRLCLLMMSSVLLCTFICKLKFL